MLLGGKENKDSVHNSEFNVLPTDILLASNAGGGWEMWRVWDRRKMHI